MDDFIWNSDILQIIIKRYVNLYSTLRTDTKIKSEKKAFKLKFELITMCEDGVCGLLCFVVINIHENETI